MTALHPELNPVQSSNIDAIGHDHRGLHVRFKSGPQVWRYPNVTAEEFERFKNAPSVGSHFASVIRKAHTGEKLDGGAGNAPRNGAA